MAFSDHMGARLLCSITVAARNMCSRFGPHVCPTNMYHHSLGPKHVQPFRIACVPDQYVPSHSRPATCVAVSNRMCARPICSITVSARNMCSHFGSHVCPSYMFHDMPGPKTAHPFRIAFVLSTPAVSRAFVLNATLCAFRLFMKFCSDFRSFFPSFVWISSRNSRIEPHYGFLNVSFVD